MTTTPTSGAADLPEALRSIQRFEVVDCIDDKHVPAVIPKPHGPWVRYEDHIAALAAGQATAAQAVVPSGWNLVPTEPTQAMLDAVVTSMDDFLLGKEAEKQYREDWAAMLAAAPAQPVAEPVIADSVQEDAARYRWLREGNDAKHGAAWHVAVNLYGCEWDAAIDAAMNKGGAA